MGRSVKFSITECLLICSDHLIKSVHTWIEDITVHCETMWCSIGVWGNCSTKSIQLNLLVGIVELQNWANALDGLQVLVPLWVEEMERITRSWVSVWEREIYGKCQVNLASSEHIFEEWVSPLDFQIFESKLRLFRQCVLLSAFFELGEGKSWQHVKEFVFSTCCRLEEFNFNLLFDIIFAEVSWSDLNLIPAICATNWFFNFWFVNWCVLSRWEESVQDEEAHTWAA